MTDVQEILLIKNGELALKGLNRSTFESVLLKNLRHRLRPLGDFRLRTAQSTILIEPASPDIDLEEACARVSRVFGISAFSRARVAPKSMDAILAAALPYLESALQAARTFKVESRRADKQFPMNSIQISQYVGGELGQFFNVKADMHHPDLTVYVEIREKYAYIHTPSVPGAGGLPIGMGGRAVSLLSGGLDSPVSSYMIARRGVELEMVHFVSPPYTSQQALDKVLELARLLTVYCGRMIVHIIPFTEIQEEIRRQCPEEYFTLIMRRFMMRLAEAVARKSHASALVTGESLGQVASQTIKALGVTEDVTKMPVLRPLIGTDKVEIIRMAREIGTYETSILPYEDCCTVFTPRHPKTKPTLAQVDAACAPLDMEGLIARALENTELVKVRWHG